MTPKAIKLTPALTTHLDEPTEEESAFIFREEELKKMPKIYKKTFAVDGYKIPYRKKKNGVYEVRKQINKILIYAASKSLETLREEIRTQLNNMRVNGPAPKVNRAVKFTTYFEDWLETVKKPLVKEDTYSDYCRQYRLHIKPAFEEIRLTWIRQFDCQKIINGLQAQKKIRTSKKVHLLLSEIFTYAVGDGLIPFSPMTNVILGVYEPDEGVPLDRSEEKQLVADFREKPTYRMQAYVFMCYTGIRRSELKSVKVVDGWVEVVTGKQRKGKKEKKRFIPISPMLARLLPYIDVERITHLNVDDLTRNFHKRYPAHHLHELRHTFTTRAKECEILPELVSVWDGHAPEDKTTTTKVYTHLWQYRELQLAEIKKYDYEL